MVWSSPVLGFPLLLWLPEVGAINFPVGSTNCHYQQWFNKSPKRVAVASSGAVEIMLAMGLVDRMVSTSWVKEVWEPLDADFQTIPNRYPKYPPAEELRASNPDMIYATFSSAFEDPSDPAQLVDNARLNYTEFLGLAADEDCSLLIPTNSYGDNKTYCRDEIHAAGINTYLAPSYCELAEHRPDEVSVAALYEEIWDIGIIFDEIDMSRYLVDGIEKHFAQALAISQAGVAPPDAAGRQEAAVEPIRVFWLDIFSSANRPDEKRPFVGACCGGPQIVLDKAGAINVFADQGKEDRRIWDRVEWEEVVATDPDLIVLIELGTESAAEKLFKLCSDPVLREMRAVQERQFLVLPFAASNIGVRLGATAYNMAEAIAALSRGKPLNALQFSPNANASEAVSLSGLKVWTTFPTFNGTDLETFCPGSPSAIDIREVSELEEMGLAQDDDEGLETWAAALIAVLGVFAVGVSLFLIKIIQKEKAGDPMFRPINREGTTV